MDIFTIEKSRQQLLKDIHSGLSGRQKLFHLNEYYEQVMIHLTGEAQIPFIIEFIPHYAKAINEFRPFGLHPGLIKKVIDSANKILLLSFIEEYHQPIKSGLQKIENEYSELIKSLHGEAVETNLHPKIIFPVIEKLQREEDILQSSCFLETVNITIQKTQNENKFTVTPGERKTDILLLEQIKTSWHLAAEYSKKLCRKIHPYHNIVIKFDGEVGTYTGNSLGIALTIGFIQEILLRYNAPYLTNIKSGIASTGSVDLNGRINSVSKEQIQKKVEGIFYSNLNTFVIPERDKRYALEKLSELQKEYHKRSLKIIGAEQFSDVFNRRDLVEIKKQPVIVRSGKFVKKNWVAASLMIIIVGLIYFAGFWDFDTNPVILKNERDWLYVQNKNGKMLWKKKMGFDVRDQNFEHMPPITHKIVDINNDGLNEVILAREIRNDNELILPNGRITCFSNKGEIIWENHFNDEIESKEMIHSRDYFAFFIDTVTNNNTKALLCFADNVLYPGAVYFIDIKNGNRIGSTLWNYGHLHSGKIGDINRDGKTELIMFGLNNAFKRSIVFSIDIDKIEGQLPTDEQKGLKDINTAKLNRYVLLPKTDYTESLTGNYNSTIWGYFLLNQDSTRIINFLMEGKSPDLKGIMIELNGDLEVTKIDLSLEFQISRDSLVSKGILSKPYTHSEEYQEILYKQIDHWDGEKFVKK